MLADRGIRTSRVRIPTPWVQTNDFKIDTCCFLVWHSALLGKDWLAQCEDNVIGGVVALVEATHHDSICVLYVVISVVDINLLMATNHS